jgi:hypothetical protein
MIDRSPLALMTANCNAEEFAQKIAHAVFGQLPEKFTTEDINKAKIALFDIHQQFKKDNHNLCKAKSFKYAHRCLSVIYEEASDKLVQLEREAWPARKSRQKQKETAVPLTPKQTTAEKIGEILTEIRRCWNEYQISTAYCIHLMYCEHLQYI